MKTSKEARKTSRELYQFSLVDGRLDAGRVQRVAKTLAEIKPRHYIDILQAFERLVRLELSRRHAVIESAQELDEAARNALKASLQTKYGQDVTTDFKVVPALIGGLRIKIGSDVFDSSIRERLSQLQAVAL